jgi:hypothetical protein
VNCKHLSFFAEEPALPPDMIDAPTTIHASGIPLETDPQSFGELKRSDGLLGDAVALRKQFAEDGYLYLPGFFPREAVQNIRADLLERLAGIGGLHADHAVDKAIPAETHPDRAARRILEGNTLIPSLVFGSRILNFYRDFFGSPVAHFDHIWMRVVRPGLGTLPHADSVYMNRGSERLMTAWIPYGNVTREIGGLMILEQSHRQAERLQNYLKSDVDTFCENLGPYKTKGGWLSKNPRTLREKLGGRWLTADFRMGDLLTFGMTTVHASLDNHSREIRLSTDTRYQPAHEAIDPRWVGPDTEEYGERNRIGKIC